MHTTGLEESFATYYKLQRVKVPNFKLIKNLSDNACHLIQSKE